MNTWAILHAVFSARLPMSNAAHVSGPHPIRLAEDKERHHEKQVHAEQHNQRVEELLTMRKGELRKDALSEDVPKRIFLPAWDGDTASQTVMRGHRWRSVCVCPCASLIVPARSAMTHCQRNKLLSAPTASLV
jgi:hypothetical protein